MDNNSIELNDELLKQQEQNNQNGTSTRSKVCLAVGTALLIINMLKCIFIGYEVYFKIQVLAIWLILQMIYRLIKKKNSNIAKTYILGVTNVFITALAAIILFCSNIIPIGIKSHSGWIYGIQKWWAEKRFGYDLSTLPDEIPENVSDYTLEAVPSYMQGTGHFAVNFRADDAVIAEYEAECSEKALMSFAFSDMTLHSYQINGDHMSVYFEDSIWQGHEKGTEIYVIADSGNRNHPDNSVVMINRKDRMITFSKLG